MVHSLGNEGARYIEEQIGIELPSSVRWTDKNNKVRRPEFVSHTLGIADVLLGLEHESRDLDGISFYEERDVLAQAPPVPKTAPSPLSLQTEYLWHDHFTQVKRNTVPDGVCILTDERTGERFRSLLFIEFDGNSMPVVRSSWQQSSIVQKMYGYADARDRHLVKGRFGLPNFRVLFVTRDHARIDTMIQAYQERCAERIPAGAFLFCDYDDLIEQGVFASIWRNAKGEPQTILL